MDMLFTSTYKPEQIDKHNSGIKLSWGKSVNENRRGVLIFLNKFVFQLYDTPDTSTQKPVVFTRIFLINRNSFNPKIGKLCLICILFYVKIYRNFVDYSMTSSLPQQGKYFLRFIWPDIIFCKYSFYTIKPFFNYHWIIGTAILTQ